MVVEDGEVALFQSSNEVAVLVGGREEEMDFVDLLLNDELGIVGGVSGIGIC